MSDLYENSNSTVRADKLDAHITEITYDEYLTNLEFMSKQDRDFMLHAQSFCKDNVADVMVESVSDSKSSSQHQKGGE
jgi:hypothetical protein